MAETTNINTTETTNINTAETTNHPATVLEARKAQVELESAIQKLVADYENRYGLSVENILLTKNLMLGYPRRVMRVLLTVQL